MAVTMWPRPSCGSQGTPAAMRAAVGPGQWNGGEEGNPFGMVGLASRARHGALLRPYTRARARPRGRPLDAVAQCRSKVLTPLCAFRRTEASLCPSGSVLRRQTVTTSSDRSAIAPEYGSSRTEPPFRSPATAAPGSGAARRPRSGPLPVSTQSVRLTAACHLNGLPFVVPPAETPSRRGVSVGVFTHSGAMPAPCRSVWVSVVRPGTVLRGPTRWSPAESGWEAGAQVLYGENRKPVQRRIVGTR